MHEIHFEKISEIIRHKAFFEKKLKIKITKEEKTWIISGTETNEYFALKVFEAMNSGFNIKIALILAENSEEYMIEHLYIKKISRRHDLASVRARVIGTKGKTKKTIEELTNCFITLHDNIVSIIGKVEDVERAMIALTKLIQGSKEASVYAYLERQKTLPVFDLGLKIKLNEKTKRSKV